MATVAPASAPAAAPAASLLALEPQLQREFQQKVQRVRKSRAAKVSGAGTGGVGVARPGVACRGLTRCCVPQEELTPGVVYIGHLPRGLCEPQMYQYFEQFGTVTRLRLSRSKKVTRLGELCLSRAAGHRHCSSMSGQRGAPCSVARLWNNGFETGPGVVACAAFIVSALRTGRFSGT